ncbi:MAG: carboxypeptidase regulatory-like domain-containing protein [Rhodanobacteraceae bacterium]
MHRFVNVAAALAIALLLGRVTDKTTGQPLSGVTVRATGARGSASAVTDRSGHFRMSRLAPGRYTLTLSSKDVPPQSVRAAVSGAAQSIGVKACSTTLDYECAGDNGTPGSSG